MKIIGFGLTKLNVENKGYTRDSNFTTAQNVKFVELEKENSELLKENDVIKLIFEYSVNYEDKSKKQLGAVLISGFLAFSASKEETKNFQKSWKKKELPQEFQLPLINLVLDKCTIKAASLEEDVNLPLHIAIPRALPNPLESK
jgi:hypothetical protein